MQINVAADVRRASAALNDVARRQIPYAAALAVNDLAFQVRAAETAALPSVFRNPRPFTRKAVRVAKASKANPTATVSVIPEVAKYLAPYEFGGKHVLPSKALLDPKSVRLDQYGQLSRTAISRMAANPRVFKGEVHGVRGFWQRMANHRLKLLLRFGNALEVKKHLDFRKRGEAIVKAQFATAWRNAMARAVGSSKS